MGISMAQLSKSSFFLAAILAILKILEHVLSSHVFIHLVNHILPDGRFSGMSRKALFDITYRSCRLMR
jgi:hypothetical protein